MDARESEGDGKGPQPHSLTPNACPPLPPLPYSPLLSPSPQIAESFSIDQFALMDAQAKYQTDPDIEELMTTVRMHFFGEEQ